MSITGNPSALPKNEDAERSVLGAVLLDEQHLGSLMIDVHLRPEHFYVPAHRLIFQAILDLYESSSKIDHLTVGDRLKQNNELEQAGGQDAIEQLTGWVPTIGHAQEYGRIVREQAQMRGLLSAADEIRTDVLGRSASPRELLDQAERLMLEVAHDEQRQRALRTVSEVLEEELENLQKRTANKTLMTGTPSGFKKLDEMTGGFQPGNLIILAARPSMGKSALMANFAENAALAGKPVVLFSLEMGESEIAQRFLASQARVKGENLRFGKVEDREWPRIIDASNRLAQAPLFIDDSSDLSILDMRAKSRRIHHQQAEQGGLGLIMVDYLQLMRADGRTDNRVEQVGQISRGLKALARELHVPVIALSQLSRNVEQRTGDGRKPVLSDLRECVTGDTLVCLADGRRVPIADLVGTEPEVLALDERHKIISARADAVWPVGRREVFEVQLASGRRIRATAKHRLLAGDGWTRVGELSIGDRVAVARSLPQPETTEWWPKARVQLLGQLIGDGSYLSGQPMRYTTASEFNSRVVVDAATQEFGATVTRYKGRGSWHQLLISGNGNRWHPAGVGAWLKELGIFNQRSTEKRIPEAAFRLPNDQIELLLRHLWATDGSIWAGPRGDGRMTSRIYYETSSRGLASDVAALLLRLGIVARIGSTVSHERRMWNVVVSGGTAQRTFLEKVGACGPRIEHTLRMSGAIQKPNTNVDTLPLECREAVRREMAAGGVTARALATRRGAAYAGTSAFKFAPSRKTMASYAKALSSTALMDMAESDVFWDQIVAIEPAGEEQVYDLTVPGPSSWLADGAITHNSGQIEQDADLVMFIYRDEYYTKEESERPGEADVIIAKHRNGSIGEVTLTFQAQYPRFVNYVPPQFD